VVAFPVGAYLVTCILIVVCSPFLHTEQVPLQGYVTFNDDGSCEADNIRNRDVTSPINEQDVESSSSRGKSKPLSQNSLACSAHLDVRPTPWLACSCPSKMLRIGVCLMRKG